MIKQINDLSAATIQDLNDNCQFVMDDSTGKTKKVSFNVLKQKIDSGGVINTEEILNLIYPIGSIYFDINNGSVCPLKSSITGSEWDKIEAKLLTDSSTAPVVGNGKTLGWSNGSGQNRGTCYYGGDGTYNQGLVLSNNDAGGDIGGDTGDVCTSNIKGLLGVSTDPSKSGLVANLGQITGVTVAIWKRTK